VKIGSILPLKNAASDSVRCDGAAVPISCLLHVTSRARASTNGRVGDFLTAKFIDRGLKWSMRIPAGTSVGEVHSIFEHSFEY
jgi:hypothetical protein